MIGTHIANTKVSRGAVSFSNNQHIHYDASYIKLWYHRCCSV